MMLSKDFIQLDVPMIAAWIKKNVRPGSRITARALYKGVEGNLHNPLAPTTFAVYISVARRDGYFGNLLKGGRGRVGYQRADDQPNKEKRQSLAIQPTPPASAIVNVNKAAMKNFIASYGTDTVGVTLLGLAAKLDLSSQYLDTLRNMAESLTDALRESAE